MVTPNNTSLIQTLYALQPGTTSSNPFVNVYQVRDPTPQDINYPIQKRWINFALTKEWILENFDSTSGFPLAHWVLLASGSSLAITLTGNTGGPVSPTGNNINVVGDGVTATINGNPGTSTLTVTVLGGGGTVTGIGVEAFTFPGTNPVLPLAGIITIEGGVTYATGTRARPIRTNSLAAGTLDLEIQLAGSNATVSAPLNFGVAQFDATQFNVVGGFVQLAGGTTPAIEKIAGNDTLDVVPTASRINLLAAVVANATDPAALWTKRTAVSTETIDIQLSTTIAATDPTRTKVGLSVFNSAQFTVDANGFVSLTASGATSSFQVDAITAPGVNPVVPTAGGLITITGIGGTTTFSSAVNTIELSAMPQPGWNNLSIAQTAGTTFTVQGFNGTALSSTNPAVVCLQRLANPGRLVNYKVIANQSFTQANISGNTWEITSAVDWANDMPFYLYAVSNGNAGENIIAFAISRIPNLTISPVVGKLAKQGSAVATTQGSMYLLPNVIVADYASSPCLLLGSFRMTYAAAGTTWTISTLNNADGIGEFNENTEFAMPISQNGNAIGAYFLANGGTAPIWAASSATYFINRFGEIGYIFASNGAVTQDGVGVVNLQMAVPLAYKGNSLNDNLGVLVTNTTTSFIYSQNPAPTGFVVPQILFVNPSNSGLLHNNDMTVATTPKPTYKISYITDLG